MGDFEFSRYPEDIELLERLSQIAASAHAPFLAGASPDLFNLDLREKRSVVGGTDDYVSEGEGFLTSCPAASSASASSIATSVSAVARYLSAWLYAVFSFVHELISRGGVPGEGGGCRGTHPGTRAVRRVRGEQERRFYRELV